MLVPAPKATSGLGAQPLRDLELLTWSRELVEGIFDEVPVQAPSGEV
jgi:hypothetical protein